MGLDLAGPVPVYGRAQVPYSQLNPVNPTFLDPLQGFKPRMWSIGDNN
jgi:hypothetical protein